MDRAVPTQPAKKSATSDEYFSTAYVDTHPDEIFYHAGGGRWKRGKPPPGHSTQKWRGPGMFDALPEDARRSAEDARRRAAEDARRSGPPPGQGSGTPAQANPPGSTNPKWQERVKKSETARQKAIDERETATEDAAFVEVYHLRGKYKAEHNADRQVFAKFLAPVLEQLLEQTRDKTSWTGVKADINTATLSPGRLLNLRPMNLSSWLSLAPPDADKGRNEDDSCLREEVVENLAMLGLIGQDSPKVHLFFPRVLSTALENSSSDPKSFVDDLSARIELVGWESGALYIAYVPELSATTEVLVVPLWDNKHFSCATIDLRTHHIVLFDSSPADEDQNGNSEKAMAMLNCILRLLDFRDPSIGRQWAFSTGLCITQVNPYDSGPLTVDNVRRLLSGEQPRATVSDVAHFCVQLRAQYLEELYQEPVDNIAVGNHLSTLVGNAIQSSQYGRLKFPGIISWIEARYPEYRLARRISALTENNLAKSFNVDGAGFWSLKNNAVPVPRKKRKLAATGANVVDNSTPLFAPQPALDQDVKMSLQHRRFLDDVKAGHIKNKLPLRTYTVNKESPERMLQGEVMFTLAHRRGKPKTVSARHAAQQAVTGNLPNVPLDPNSSVYRACTINSSLRTLENHGVEVDLVEFWKLLFQANARSRLGSKIRLSMQEALDTQLASHEDMAIRACFICAKVCYLPHMHKLAKGQLVCIGHVDQGQQIPDPVIPAATQPIEPINVQEGDHAWLGGRNVQEGDHAWDGGDGVVRSIRSITRLEGLLGSGVVSQQKLHAHVRSFFRDPAHGIWWDPWVEEWRDLNDDDPTHPSVDCTDPLLFLDGAIYKHCADNTTLMPAMWNYMKALWSRMLLPLMGMAARQTRSERVNKAAGALDWHDDKFWDWWHNAIAHVHFLVHTFPRHNASRFGIPMPDSSTQAAFATAMKTGRYTASAVLLAQPLQSYNRSQSEHSGILWPQIEEEWFLARFIQLTDEIEHDTGVKVPRMGSTRLPWPFHKSQEPKEETEAGVWWKRQMLSRFTTSYEWCDKANKSNLVKNESPLTWGLLFVVSWCENDGCDSFIFCQMSPYMKSPISASIGRLTHVEAATMMESGWITPWPTSFSEHYIKSKRTVGPQPLCINYLWHDWPKSTHSMMFDELCRIKESNEYCPAPAKDLQVLQFPSKFASQSWVEELDMEHDEEHLLIDEEDLQLDEEDLQLDEVYIGLDESDGEQRQPEAFGQHDDDSLEVGASTASTAPQSLATMRMVLDALKSELQLQGGVAIDAAQDGLDFMSQSLRDGDETGFYMLREQMVRLQYSGRRVNITEQLQQAATTLDTGIEKSVTTLGAGSFAAIGFYEMATKKQTQLRAAIAAKSLLQFNAKRAELRNMIREVIDEVKRRQPNNNMAVDRAHVSDLRQQSKEEEQRLSDLKNRTAEAEGTLAQLKLQQEQARQAIEQMQREAEEQKARVEQERKERERTALEEEHKRNKSSMDAINEQTEVLRAAYQKLEARNLQIEGKLKGL